MLGLTSYLMAQPLSLESEKSEQETTEKTGKAAGKNESTEPASSVEPTETKEESQQAAYNPDTGEINWDCPCLGGMAHGPCGEEFKEAFSCFVFSESEPKGFDCIEKFKNMQNCFRRYPEVYSEEIRGDEEPVEDFNSQEDKPAATLGARGVPTQHVENADVVVDVVEVSIPTDTTTETPEAGAPVNEIVFEEVVIDTEVATPEKN
jgi:intermembrane space import and assembly protein 40